MHESMQGVKGNISFAKSPVVEPVLQGSRAIVQLAGPMGLHHQNIPGCSSWPKLASTVALADATSAFALDKHCLHFYAGNRRESDLKKKIWSLSWFTFLKKLFEVILRIYLFFTMIIPSQRSMITVRDAWRAGVVTVFWPCVSMLACSDWEAHHLPTKCNCRPFSSPHHLRLIFIFSLLSPARLTVISILFFTRFGLALTVALTVNAPLRNQPPPPSPLQNSPEYRKENLWLN